MLDSDKPMNRSAKRQEMASVFAKVPTIGDRRYEGREPVAQEEPEPVEEVETAEEVGEADDVAGAAQQEPESEPDADDEDKEVFVIKVDGEEIEVTLDELQRGYSRQSDYTRKTQALSEERKVFTEERQQVQQMAQVLGERLSEVENLLSQAVQEPDWAELSKQLDPREYNLARAQWDQQNRQLQAIQAQKQELMRVQQAEFEREVQRAQARLPVIIPDWSDQETARTEAREIRDYALSVGFSEEALDSLYDPLAVKVLRDAWRYNQLQKAKPTIRRKKSPRSAKAGPGVPKRKQTPSILQGPVKGTRANKDVIDYFQNVPTRK